VYADDEQLQECSINATDKKTKFISKAGKTTSFISRRVEKTAEQGAW
jgi:hypothetical protein